MKFIDLSKEDRTDVLDRVSTELNILLLFLRGSLTKSDITLRPFARPCVPTEPDPVY